MFVVITHVGDQRGLDFIEKLCKIQSHPSIIEEENNVAWNSNSRELLNTIVEQMLNDEYIITSLSIEKSPPVAGA